MQGYIIIHTPTRSANDGGQTWDVRVSPSSSIDKYPFCYQQCPWGASPLGIIFRYQMSRDVGVRASVSGHRCKYHTMRKVHIAHMDSLEELGRRHDESTEVRIELSLVSKRMALVSLTLWEGTVYKLPQCGKITTKMSRLPCCYLSIYTN
jgi:hypothetical protein